MSNYSKVTDFSAKDSLSTGNPAKIVKGTEIDDELTAISGAISSKADTESPTLTGTPAAPTASVGTSTTQIASTAYVVAEIASRNTTANVNSAIAGSSVGGIGTYAFLQPTNNNTYQPGDTLAGSSLRYTGVGSGGIASTTSSIPSGTWRCMGYTYVGAGTPPAYYNVTLWLRIS